GFEALLRVAGQPADNFVDFRCLAALLLDLGDVERIDAGEAHRVDAVVRGGGLHGALPAGGGVLYVQSRSRQTGTAMSVITTRIEGELPVEFEALLAAAEAEGVNNMRLLADDWQSGRERFTEPGALFGAWLGGDLA